jgi:hypothetical protein
MTIDLDAIYAKMAAGTCTYDDAADLFMNSLTGQSTGVSREEFIERLRAKLPTQEALAAQMRQYAAMVSVMYAHDKAARPEQPEH